MKKTIWSPQQRQKVFQSRGEYEALYGGAAGGGKTDALVAEALRQVHIPHYRAIIFRKTYTQLTDIIDKSRFIYKLAYPKAKYNSTEHCWTFPSGAKIYFGQMQYVKDRVKYQGKAFDFIAFDELTHFTFDEYSYMFSRNRPSGPGTRVYMRAATNPGGIGHGWVKDRFITAATPMTPIVENINVLTPDGKRIDMQRSRIFVPSTVFDNKILLENNPNYLASLQMLPSKERDALLYGSWDSFDGQVFREWTNNPDNYESRRWTHVISPFKIPKSWRIYRGFDWGYSKPFAVLWYAVDTDGKMYQINEFYGTNGTPNVGIQMNAADIAANIRKIEAEDENIKGHDIVGIADPAIFEESMGESIARIMEKPPNCILWRRGDHTRIAGKMQIHHRLSFDDDGDCLLQIFNTCKHTIRTLPSLVYDETKTEDVDTKGEDHIYDAKRYVCMAHPVGPRKSAIPPIVLGDPLHQHESDIINNKYKFYRV